jgi:hypothetical protein
MHPDDPSSNGTPPHGSLPPVEPPSARFILQLFLVPLLLVGVFGATIYFLFGWIGLGSSDPYKLMDDLESGTSEKVRWKAAQDLAQILPRDPRLQKDVQAALRLATILKKEMSNPPPADKDEMDFLKYLPAALGNFHAPVGLPLVLEIASAYVDKLDDEGSRERLYNSLHALAIMGDKLQRFEQLTVEEQEQILSDLQGESLGSSERSRWARAAHDYLLKRREHAVRQGAPPLADTLGLIPVLTRTSRCDDELARKFTLMALTQWREAGADQLLRELSGANQDLTRFVNNDHERGRRELRQNAVLALARRGSTLTPWPAVVELLDEDALRQQTAAAGDELATRTLLKAINDLRTLRTEKPAVYAQQKEVHEAVARLENSRVSIIQIEARKLSGGSPVASSQATFFSREVLLIGTFGLGVLFLLALAVFARWKRKPVAVA